MYALDTFVISLLIVTISAIIGVCLLFPILNNKKMKKISKYTRIFIFIIAIIIYISFIFTMTTGDHIDQKFIYKGYYIDKLTLTDVYFDNRSISFDTSYTILEIPNENYENMVIAEIEDFYIQWFFKINLTTIKYHVYLTEDTYNRLLDGDIIYENCYLV